MENLSKSMNRAEKFWRWLYALASKRIKAIILKQKGWDYKCPNCKCWYSIVGVDYDKVTNYGMLCRCNQCEKRTQLNIQGPLAFVVKDSTTSIDWIMNNNIVDVVTLAHTFTPHIHTIDDLAPRSLREIRDETMLFGADWEYAQENGGPILKEFLAKLYKDDGFFWHFRNHKKENQNIVIDARVTMTMPGAYPSLPGWHCDDFNRSERYAQPNPEDANDKVTHFMAIVGESEDGNSCTQFVTEPLTIILDRSDVWHSLDKAVNALPECKTRFIRNREIVQFNQNAIHRATPTKTPGWRLFVRCSFTHRPVHNEIRKQVQIYVDRNGW